MGASRDGDARSRAPGFTLVEVLVALVVLELGLLGAASLVVLAARLSARARELERASWEAQEVADSLAWAGFGGSGARERHGYRIRWADVEGTLRIEVSREREEAGRPLLQLAVPGALPERVPAPADGARP